MTVAQKVAAELSRAAAKEIEIVWRCTGKRALCGWCDVHGADDLLPLAQGVAALEGRLSAITGSLGAPEKEREVAYHFDIDGTTLTVTVALPLHGASVPTLSGTFRNALWCERELMEFYQISVTGHPDPRRLFVDESLEAAVLERLIPYSSFINAASAKNVFESVLREEESP